MYGRDNVVTAPRVEERVLHSAYGRPSLSTFLNLQEWAKWIRMFERFRSASNLNENSDENQVNTLIYCMGDEADDILW